ncbi:hypothetical protein J9309_08165 [Faecalibacter bovis]|uniref:Hsp70 family protein n=1 Tax=Faecalibacter bovis TaxID=2898187 RepID=A0ABX7XA36_9FLAO|nr:hypothetical protein [Faecalibacter bovis]QTV04781.1 hypothetical protein J9309_08165 [Faecalibacter bovis]
MSNQLNLGTLVPSLINNNIVQDQLKNSTFIGIDFGTSTTVISYTITGDNSTPIHSDVMPVRQKNLDGGITVNHLIPSCIAWYNQQLYIGHTAKMLKSKLQYGRNLWYSFKMKLGTDNGPEYVSTELPQGGEYVIEKPLDAVKVFVKYLKNEIDYFIKENNLPSKVFYSISIPASFESNQRKDLNQLLVVIASVKIPK